MGHIRTRPLTTLHTRRRCCEHALALFAHGCRPRNVVFRSAYFADRQSLADRRRPLRGAKRSAFLYRQTAILARLLSAYFADRCGLHSGACCGLHCGLCWGLCTLPHHRHRWGYCSSTTMRLTFVTNGLQRHALQQQAGNNRQFGITQQWARLSGGAIPIVACTAVRQSGCSHSPSPPQLCSLSPKHVVRPRF